MQLLTVFHIRDCYGNYITKFIFYSVGRKIVTKRHDKDDDDGDSDMEDITSHYKNPEGTLHSA
jgi:hypothetical protein